jgi:hypothetical protein
MRSVCSVRAPPRTPPVRARTHARGRDVCVAREAQVGGVDGFGREGDYTKSR